MFRKLLSMMAVALVSGVAFLPLAVPKVNADEISPAVASSTAPTATSTGTNIATTTTGMMSTSTATSTPIASSSASSDLLDNCTVTQADLDTIQAIRSNPNITYNEELSEELNARKTLLNTLISCAEGEVTTLTANLAAAVPGGSQATQVESQLAGRLNDATTYYELERSKLTGAGIYGTEQVAKEVLTWRTTSFTTMAEQVDAFLLWSKNQALFSAATSRMTQVGQVVSYLSSTDNNDLATAFASAQASFQAARNQNAAALDAIGQLQPSDQISTLIQESLTSLSNTYQSLFTVSNIIQGLIPQTAQ